MSETELSICVFCGARPGVRPEYEADAKRVGALIAQEGWRLVYGAGDVGLMGAVADAAQSQGADTFGVIPIHLVNSEKRKAGLGRSVVTENMHERKKVMFMNSDAIVVLPGGAGSLDEFFEVLTWRQLGLHDKPIFVLNTQGYWARLSDLLDHLVTEGFAGTSIKDYVTFIDDVETLAADLRALRSRRSASPE